MTAATKVILVMGVAGSGKTTVGRALAERLGSAFLDADDLHPAANVEKMRAGHPLTDADRAPWLDAIAAWIDAREGAPCVIACSALKRAYRARLRRGRDGFRLVFLRGDQALIRSRAADRPGHYWPASLTASQFADLEPPGPDEAPITVDADQPLDALVDAVVARLA